MNMKIDLNNKVALVTGAAQGIGFETAKTLCQAGAQVIISDINKAAGEEAVKKLQQENYNARFIYCDVSSDTDTTSLIDNIIKQDKSLDILVNNAGIICTGDIIDVSVSEWEKLFDINVKSVFMLTKKTLPHMMKNKWGRIINISSVAGEVGGGFLGNTCYGATKGAIMSFSKGIAREAGPYNITTNTICPGMTGTSIISENMDQEIYKKAIESIPLRKHAFPQDIANGIVFLASDLANYVNGVTFNIDGGLVRY
ncbi:NAD(P)-dependent dehydrogenase [Commensalibacter communis]|nr:NAD(P)-dependent dehydrogenase [Commensalibacter communis]CAI3949140.1 NAD(P)-dependent dehydrogenase [Commensalibacter communis]